MLNIQCLDRFLFLDETVICVLEDLCPQSAEAEPSHPSLSSRQKQKPCFRVTCGPAVPTAAFPHPGHRLLSVRVPLPGFSPHIKHITPSCGFERISYSHHKASAWNGSRAVC